MKSTVLNVFLKSQIVVALLMSVNLQAQNLKFMTYNIRYATPRDGENAWSKRKDLVVNQIRFYEPDVLGIQEGLNQQVTFIDDELENYVYFGVGRDNGKKKGEYCAIYYQSKKFRKIDGGTFWLSTTPNKISVGWDAALERICTYLLLEDKETSKRFWVFNAHFDHRGKQAREKSSELILDQIRSLNKDTYPVVLMGDLNAKPQDAPIQILAKELNDTKEVSLNPPFGPDGTFNGFRFQEPVSNRIDYIFVSKDNVEVQKYAILSDSKDGRYLSDHLPVFAEIRLK
ncbi:endonuclease/exonuclease/phosphatase family protein [Fulvivirgaceae bacterium BMA10]|uniref:Endonuclease/exonuclease/phosphatase family protein n=1 Tax=Splendidivirga corallicola TaxID=3051826 RepID=A0ABT8KIR4_9BACT|nr:endonuclease/exonuclease/phosphatase family protein [Fulvivirgaceae bacterium BMA10]